MIAPKKKIWVGMAILAVIVGSVIWWFTGRSGPEQFISLPSGEKYRLVGVTYGTDAAPPSMLARVVHRLPGSTVEFLQKHWGHRIDDLVYYDDEKFDRPRLMVWFKYVGTNGASDDSTLNPIYRPRSVVLADASGVIAGVQTYGFSGDNNSGWHCVQFSVVPRRTPVLQLRVYRGNIQDRDVNVLLGQVTFPNPMYGHYPQWQPEALPIVKQSGGLEVRLDDVRSGTSQNGGTSILRPNGSRSMQMVPATGGAIIETQFDYSIRWTAETDERWILQRFELSDATGNLLQGQGLLSPISEWVQAPLTGADWHGYSGSLYGALWPNETAWKLALEFKRSLGIESNEIVTFRNIPIPALWATNTVAYSTNLNGRRLVLKDFVRNQNYLFTGGNTPPQQLSKLVLDVPGKLDGFALDVLHAETDAGMTGEYKFGSQSGETNVLLFKSIPTNATRMDLTVVLQKTRRVEFLVKPTGTDSPKL